jgi:transcription elongation factor GreB
LARALVGKALDAEVRVQTPTGEQLVYIVAIDYL